MNPLKTNSPILLALMLLSAAPGWLGAQVPGIINFQGQIANVSDGTNFNGAGQFKFALVNGAGSVSYWSNDGTSTAGSEPAAAVAIAVGGGIYTVNLGDATLVNMTAIPLSVFANSDVRVRIWFNDGTNGSQLLAPDTRIVSVGYAMVAGSATTAATANSVAAANITGAILNSSLPASPTFSGTVMAANFVGSGAGLSGVAQNFGTAIPSLPYTISQPGLYYLTNNLSTTGGNAITITANGVTLDLNGFTISSTRYPAGGTAIELSGVPAQNITVQNGFILGGVTNNGGVYDGPGFAYGIAFDGFGPNNIRMVNLTISGCYYSGIYLGTTGNATTVDSCLVNSVSSVGIFAGTVSKTTVSNCGGGGILASQATDCRCLNSSGGSGISAAIARNCYASVTDSGDGINCTTAENCYGYSQSGAGIYSGSAQNCYGFTTGGGAGLTASCALNCQGGNNSGNGGYGVQAEFAQNCFGSTSTTGYGLYAIVAQNSYGLCVGGYGIYASTAQNCYGYSSGGGTGSFTFYSSIGCFGYSESGTGLQAFIANSSHGVTGSGMAESINNKYNMP